MPIYKTTIVGTTTPRFIRAETAARARDYLVKTEMCSAEELADAIEAGATIEKAPDKPANEPAAESSQGELQTAA